MSPVCIFRYWDGGIGGSHPGWDAAPDGPEADQPSPCCLTVPEVTILEPLKDMQLSEGQDAHFRCRLSRASGQEARWALGGVPLQANEMNNITVEQGMLHLLTLHKVGSGASLCPSPSWGTGGGPTPVRLCCGHGSRGGQDGALA